MSETEDRRLEIMRILENRQNPISGTALADLFSVSRQIIVQDIAILKAENQPIISTNRGYKIRRNNDCIRIIKVAHNDKDIKDELSIIVDSGASIKDVFVNHKVYGRISVDLNISTKEDIENFMKTLESGISRPLKNLTENYHYHTIIADNEKILDTVEMRLQKSGYLLIKTAEP